MKPPKPPRGLIISTGEDVPKGQSLRARVLIDELELNDIDWYKLTMCQEDAARGFYAEVVASYVSWLAPRYEEVRSNFRIQVAELRAEALASSFHKRTPEILANLGIGLRHFFDFVVEAGAWTKAEADDRWEFCWEALGQAAASQAKHQAASDPVRRFLELLNSAISSGRAHIAGDDGNQPDRPAAWGWREHRVGTGENERIEWRFQGPRVGWVSGEDLFLDPDAAYIVTQALSRELGDSIPLTTKTLHKRLHERGLLQATDQSRGTLSVRRMLEGRRREVLYLRAETLLLDAEHSPPEKGFGPEETDQE
jgi:hypothetical protein